MSQKNDKKTKQASAVSSQKKVSFTGSPACKELKNLVVAILIGSNGRPQPQ